MASSQKANDDGINLWQGHMSDEEIGIPDSDQPSDYSSRMEELFGDEHELGSQIDDEEFLYTGVDADTTSGYHDQLRAILGPEVREEIDEDTLGQSLTYGADPTSDEKLNGVEHVSQEQDLENGTEDIESDASSVFQYPGSNYENMQLLKPPRPILHPSVSRLRAHVPAFASHALRDTSFASAPTPPGDMSVSSHFSSMSHESSPILPSGAALDGVKPSTTKQREVFRWTDLGGITHYFYSPQSQKSNAILGTLSAPRPTVLAANGMICIGTEHGSVHVFDFKQSLKCVCGADINGRQTVSALDYWEKSIDLGLSAKDKVGRVTAVALSHDHTYIASGHSTGHIFLYNLSEPNVPARSVAPTTLSAVTSGRKEGHLKGSRVVSIAFIGARHTAIASADEHGLAFYHNLSKVLFVEAFDTLRILGRYPEVDQTMDGHASSNVSRKKKAKFTVLGLSPLPLSALRHVTDNYQVIAMLTPTKLVVVGLRPSPKTWFKCPRGADEGVAIKSMLGGVGTLAWFPSTSQSLNDVADTSNPMLAYSWGNSVHIIKVKERREIRTVQTDQKGKFKQLEIGMIVYENVCEWSTQEVVLSIQWLNANIIIFTSTTLEIHNAHKGDVIENVPFDTASLVNPLWRSVSEIHQPLTVADAVAHSVRVYKGKIFVLCQERLQVGTLMTWADQILSCVQVGDFLSAIELCRSFYVNEAPGNRNGLPLDSEERRNVIGERMRGLLLASAQYAFSEERLTDDTHITPDHRGVDRTSLFEELVAVSCRACIALDDYDFLYEDLFQQYDQVGIARIYLSRLQPFILDNTVRNVPPRIIQRLIALHEEDNHPDEIERLIWHIDPACLDINQAVSLCQRYQLYDALVYVYTCALRDYVSPIVEFLGIIRRKLRSDLNMAVQDPTAQELSRHAYRIYPYLEAILTGHIYPSNELLGMSDSLKAKTEVFSFLSSGTSCVWPRVGGHLILTSVVEGGEEPTYPYIRQLLTLDSEWFLHSLDEAFEQAFLVDELQVHCQTITRILLEILSTGLFSSADATFIRIFIARNVAKYPQFLQYPNFIHASPNTLLSILVGLTEVKDPGTREDRQLAAESLLSIYHPENWDDIVHLLTRAGFYRILRQKYLQNCQWSALLTTYLDDTSIGTSDAINGINESFTAARTSHQGHLPTELIMTLESKLPAIVDIDIGNAASLIDEYQPDLHDHALNLLEYDFQRFQYLRQLLEPITSQQKTADNSRILPKHIYYMYLSLQCRFEPKKVIDVLKTIPSTMLDWDQAMRTCESCGVYEAVVWALSRRHAPEEAIAKAGIYLKQLTSTALDLEPGSQIHDVLNASEAVIRMGIAICLEHSLGEAEVPSQPEDLWLQLFRSQIYCIQAITGTHEGSLLDERHLLLLPLLRSLVQETFGFLVSAASSKVISFPRLFKRLVESVSSSSGAHYTEFQSILTGMLDSYRTDGDMLAITKQLVSRDLFDTMAVYAGDRVKGWAPSAVACSYCKGPIYEKPRRSGSTENKEVADYQVSVSRTGVSCHVYCSSQQ